MTMFNVKMDSMDKITFLANMATKFSCGIDVRSSDYIVNGKSILGLCAVSESKTVRVIFYGNDNDACSFRQMLGEKMEVM